MSAGWRSKKEESLWPRALFRAGSKAPSPFLAQLFLPAGMLFMSVKKNSDDSQGSIAEGASISIVVPAYNESENLPALHMEITKVCLDNNYDFEIIFVDDGSDDDTASVLANLAPLKTIRFRKNFGQTAALDAGIKHASGDLIVTLDGDGQNDPADIPNLLRHLRDNDLDAVSGWRKNRKDTLGKRFVSKVANFLRHFFINDNIHDSGCTLKIYKKECFEQLSLYGEMHRFIPALLKIKGFKIGEIEVNHRPRKAGKSKYGPTRAVKGFIDMISVWFWNKYAVRPLHLLGGMGLLSFALGSLSAAYTVFYFISGGDLSNTVWPLLTVFFLFSGAQLFISGLIADMLAKNYYGTTRDSSYCLESVRKNN
jgi:glycosyltransferase involved in cell wall biosynthesis